MIAIEQFIFAELGDNYYLVSTPKLLRDLGFFDVDMKQPFLYGYFPVGFERPSEVLYHNKQTGKVDSLAVGAWSRQISIDEPFTYRLSTSLKRNPNLLFCLSPLMYIGQNKSTVIFHYGFATGNNDIFESLSDLQSPSCPKWVYQNTRYLVGCAENLDNLTSLDSIISIKGIYNLL